MELGLKLGLGLGLGLGVGLGLGLRSGLGSGLGLGLSQTTRVRAIPDYPGRRQVRALRPDVHIFGHTHWEVGAR